MENLLSFLFLAVGVGLIIFFVYRKKKNKELAEQKQIEEKKLLEEKKQKRNNELKVKWEETEKNFKKNGLPILDPETLNLKKNEVCHFVGNASFCKLKQQTVGYEGGSHGTSFRIMKGVSFRVGNYQGKYIKEEFVEKTNGTITITNKKMIFSAIVHSCVIKHNDIINLNVIDDFLQIQTDDKTYLFQVEDYFNFLAILNYIMNTEKEKN